jgi:hypothetical protein
MLKILGSESLFSQMPNRREVLRAGALSAFGVSLPMWLRLSELQAAADKPIDSTFGKAKRVLLLYLQGAASQFETWDPKPDAPSEIKGPWGAISTVVPGTQICEKLPKMAQSIDRVTLIRSMTHAYNNHSNHYTLTGYPTVDFTSETNPRDSRHHPFFGSILDYLADQRNPGERPDVPRNIGLPFPYSQFSPLFRRAGPYGAFLGAGYDPVWTEFQGKATKSVGRVPLFDASQKVNVEDPFLGITPESRMQVSSAARLRDELTIDRFDSRRSLLQQIDSERRRLAESEAPRNLDRFQSMAYSLMTSEKIRIALDIGLEPMSLRESYGMTLFGQAVLTGRRLLDAGARIVSVFWDEYKIVNTGWDTHFDHTTRLGDELLPGLDSALSTLLRDLEGRGMLDDTLVMCLTEHGRTPRLGDETRNGGRDHWSQAYSVLLAGAGIRRGAVLGASDHQGAFVKDRAVSPEDVLATMYHLMGVSPDTFIPDRLQRPIRLVAHGDVIRDVLA